MTPLLCPTCGAVDAPVLSPGTGAHTVEATCAHCGALIKTVPRALLRLATGTAPGQVRGEKRR
jgi:hypothetical protein